MEGRYAQVLETVVLYAWAGGGDVKYTWKEGTEKEGAVV